MGRDFTKKEKAWILKLRNVIKSEPSTLAVRQSNEDSGLIFYDSKTGVQIYDNLKTVRGFREMDPYEYLDNKKPSEGGQQ